MNILTVLAIPLIGAFVTFVIGNKSAKVSALIFSVLTFAASLYMLVAFSGGNEMCVNIPWISTPKISFSFLVDGLSLAMTLLTTALIPIIIFTTRENQIGNPRVVYALILVMEMAMLGTFCSSDGLLYYIFWELSLIPIYFIILLWGNGTIEKRKKTVTLFFIYTVTGSLFMLVSILYLYYQSGSFSLEQWYALRLPADVQNWVFAGFFLAYAIKIPLIPFHSWQASTYQKAPAYGTMLLAGIMLKMGLYSILRWQLPVAPLAAANFKYILIALSIAGVIYGSIITLRQHNIKRFLAYSSLAHVGLIAAGIYTLTYDGIRGAILQMIAHGFVVVGLFYVAEVIHKRWTVAEISQMGGIKAQAPKFSLAFMMILLASVALPLTFNFVGEFTILYGLSQVSIYLALAGGLTIILGAFYMLRLYQQSMLGVANEKPFIDLNWKESSVFALIILTLLFFGIYPKPLFELIEPSVITITNHIQAALAAA